MKKLRLKALSLGAREILNREQLKGIYGGFDGSGSDDPPGGGGGPTGGGCNSETNVNWHCVCLYPTTPPENLPRFDCCTADAGDWPCRTYYDTLCPGAMGYSCNPA